MNSLTRWDPFRISFPRWFDDFEEPVQRGLKIHETKDSIVAEAVVAGVPAKDIEVNIENGVLTIKAEKKLEKETKQVKQTTSYQYYYTAALSGGAWDNAEAEIEDGVVVVTIPKAEEVKPRRIAVKTKGK